MKDAVDFFKTAITDTQSTIRAIDAKVSFLSAALVFPLAGWDKISQLFFFCSTFPISCLYFLILIVTVASWLFAFVNALLCLSSTVNPIAHMPDDILGKSSGIFYRGGANIFSIFRTWPKNHKSKISWIDPDKLTEELVANEYQFEQCKLCLIRDVKILRQKRAYLLFFTSFIGLLMVFLIKWIVIATPCACK